MNRKLITLLFGVFALISSTVQAAIISLGLADRNGISVTITPDAAENGMHNVYMVARYGDMLYARDGQSNWLPLGKGPLHIAERVSLAGSKSVTLNVTTLDVSPLVGLEVYVAYGIDEAAISRQGHLARIFTVIDPAMARVVNATGRGAFREATLLNSLSAEDIVEAIRVSGKSSPLIPQYGVRAYRITYVTMDAEGQDILASALVVLPQKPGAAISPVLSYQHGTITQEGEAPSYLADPIGPEILLASLGTIVASADYVGYGVSRGAAHPYLYAEPSAAAVVDMLEALRYWLQTQQIIDNGQLFFAGYSEGAYVTLAAQRALQASTSPLRQQLVAVAVGSGPYDVLLTLDKILERIREQAPALGALLRPGFLKYLNHSVRDQIRDELLQAALGEDSDVTIHPRVLDRYLDDDRSTVEAEANVYDWLPEVPVSLFHGKDDPLVTYLNSVRTLEAMQARGAGERVTLIDCAVKPADHRGCISPYFRFILQTFAPVVKDL